jgi:hypothetical protein
MKTLKTFTEPETVIICGAWVEDKEVVLKITDDESPVTIRKYDGWCVDMYSYGHIYILTEKEFFEFINSNHFKEHYKEEYDENYYVVIKDYIGTIGATGLTENREESDDWDINEYFNHQVEDDALRLIIDITGKYHFNSTTFKQTLEFLKSDETSKAVEVKKISVEERIKLLEKKVESQTKQIALLSDSIDWCERNIK